MKIILGVQDLSVIPGSLSARAGALHENLSKWLSTLSLSFSVYKMVQERNLLTGDCRDK